jgi:transcriptional regulator with XRE-family HTH domain
VPGSAEHDLVPTLSDVVASSVRAERARRHWTQAELATRTGLSRTTIGDIEVGRRQVTANHLPLFCRALDVPLSVLVAGADAADLDALDAGKVRSR